MAKFKDRKFLNQGETILKPGGAYASKLRLEKLQCVTNVCTHFQNNCSKIVVGICHTKLPVFCSQTDTRTDGHTDV